VAACTCCLYASKRIQEGVALVLAVPILRGYFEDGMTNVFLPQMKNIIRQAYSAIRGPGVEDHGEAESCEEAPPCSHWH
jgi:hypothetical protein